MLEKLQYRCPDSVDIGHDLTFGRWFFTLGGYFELNHQSAFLGLLLQKPRDGVGRQMYTCLGNPKMTAGTTMAILESIERELADVEDGRTVSHEDAMASVRQAIEVVRQAERREPSHHVAHPPNVRLVSVRHGRPARL